MDHYKDIGERADKLKAQLEIMGPGKWNFTGHQAAAWWGMIEDANGAVENGVRLAAYIAPARLIVMMTTIAMLRMMDLLSIVLSIGSDSID